jgi:hypothetical protein
VRRSSLGLSQPELTPRSQNASGSITPSPAWSRVRLKMQFAPSTMLWIWLSRTWRPITWSSTCLSSSSSRIRSEQTRDFSLPCSPLLTHLGRKAISLPVRELHCVGFSDLHGRQGVRETESEISKKREVGGACALVYLVNQSLYYLIRSNKYILVSNRIASN